MDRNSEFWKVPDDAFYLDFDKKGRPALWLSSMDGAIEDAMALEDYLVSRFDAKITRKVDGVYEGVWAFKIDGLKLYIAYDDYQGFGIYSVRRAKKYHDKLEEIADDLRGRFWTNDEGYWYIE